MNEENEIVYPEVTDEAKAYQQDLMSGFDVREGMRTGEIPQPTTEGETGTTTQTTDTSTEKVEQEVKPQEEEEATLFGESFKNTWQENNKFDAKNPLTWSNIPSAMGAGVTDFGIDLVNKLPNVAIPKLPRYEDETLNFVRDASAFIIPQLYLSKYFKGKANMAHAKVKWKLGDGTFARFFGPAGIDAGVGVFVDSVNSRNETDHNLLGTMKQSWPKTWGWIPDNMATLDEDSPDVKRIKNINEGVGLSFASDFLLGANKLIKSIKGVDEATKWIPKSEQAKNWVKSQELKFGKLSDNVGEDAMMVNDARRVAELDDIGRYNISQGADLNKPVKGVHDIYDDYEVGYRSADSGGLLGAEFDSYRWHNNIDSVHGRTGSVFTPGAMKNSLDLDDLELTNYLSRIENNKEQNKTLVIFILKDYSTALDLLKKLESNENVSDIQFFTN